MKIFKHSLLFVFLLGSVSGLIGMEERKKKAKTISFSLDRSHGAVNSFEKNLIGKNLFDFVSGDSKNYDILFIFSGLIPEEMSEWTFKGEIEKHASEAHTVAWVNITDWPRNLWEKKGTFPQVSQDFLENNGLQGVKKFVLMNLSATSVDGPPELKNPGLAVNQLLARLDLHKVDYAQEIESLKKDVKELEEKEADFILKIVEMQNNLNDVQEQIDKKNKAIKGLRKKLASQHMEMEEE